MLCRNYISISPKLICRVESTFFIVACFNVPNLFISRCLSIDRIWFSRTTDFFVMPPSGGRKSTSVGYKLSSKRLVIAATIVIGLYSFETSFWRISAGRVFFDFISNCRIEIDQKHFTSFWAFRMGYHILSSRSSHSLESCKSLSALLVAPCFSCSRIVIFPT